MKRSRHSSRHAAVLTFQPFKGFQRIGIAQDARDLPAAGGIGRLSLRGGLGLRLAHGSGRHSAHEVHALRVALPAGELFRDALPAVPAGFSDGKEAGLAGDPDQRPALFPQGGSQAPAFGNDGSGFGVHGYLRVGGIPTVGPSYRVTSDMSMTVCREAA